MTKYKTLAHVERRLEELYDQNLQTSQEYVDLEATADRLASAETVRQSLMHTALEKERKRNEEIRARLEAGDLNVIDAYGFPEFGDDYETVTEGNDVAIYSRVAGPDQNDRHLFPNQEQAKSKLRKLIWDRLYSKYVRSGDIEHLSELAV